MVAGSPVPGRGLLGTIWGFDSSLEFIHLTTQSSNLIHVIDMAADLGQTPFVKQLGSSGE